MITRTARVIAEGTVAKMKLSQIDHLTREAITGQIMLAHWADTLAGSNQLIHDEISIFRDVARIAKAQIIADTVDTYCEEGRMR